ncbi:MAG: DNA primase small subunit domain-containing protein [Desulfurococcaceae archaeon]
MWPREQINRFIKNLVCEYYRHRPLEEPSYIHLREIALESLEDEKYIRHLSFAYMDQLYNYIINVKTPLHLYYSSALYLNPGAERMEEKTWIGSEILFDLDADKYEGCRNTVYICVADNLASSEHIDKCPNGEKPIEYVGVPWQCIEKALNDSMKLNDILKDELGFKNIKIYFSGNRGFHIKIYDNDVLDLGRDERRLIADYISCEGLVVDKVFPSYKNNVVLDAHEAGLRKRVFNIASKQGLISRRNMLGFKDIYVIRKDHLEEILKESCIERDGVVAVVYRLLEWDGTGVIKRVWRRDTVIARMGER